MWYPQDITLAKEIFALSPSRQKDHSTDNEHGADILFGGHDHLYYIAKGVDSWDGFEVTRPTLGAEADEGDVLVVKSGSDFKDLSEIQLPLYDTAEGSVRRKVISEIRGVLNMITHHSLSIDLGFQVPAIIPLQTRRRAKRWQIWWRSCFRVLAQL